MTTPASAADRALVRATAEQQRTRTDLPDGYDQIIDGTLAVLDWVEGRRATAPATGDRRAATDLVEQRYGPPVPATSVEIGLAGSIDEHPETAEQHRTRRYHGAVWVTLEWLRDRERFGLAVYVPELEAERDARRQVSSARAR